MSTDNTQNSKSDFSLYGCLVFINVTVSLFSFIFLGILHNLMNFTMKESYACNRLHGNIFSTFAEQQGLCLSNATLWIFLISLVTIFISFIFYFRNEKKYRHLFLMLATGLNVTAGLYYVLMYLFWADCKFGGKTGEFIFYCVLMVIGIASLIWGIFIHKTKEECRTKKWIPIVLSVILVIPVFFCMAYPFITLKTEKAEIDALRQTIAAQDMNYDAEIGYQIGNYVNRNAVYVEDKLYLTKYNTDTETDEILSVDKSGNMEVFWTAPNEIKNISDQLYYHDGYLYILVNKKETDSNNCDMALRISIADGKEETLLESEDNYIYFGIHNGLLLICFSDKETKSESIYAYDLSSPITEENGCLYDYELSYMVLDRPIFTNYYVYGNREHHYFGSYNNPYMSMENIIYKSNDNGYNNSGSLYWATSGIESEDGDVIDPDEVIAYNIFDSKVYYIKYPADYSGNEPYEVYSYEPSNEEKVLIGTIPVGSFRNCYNMSMAEDFVIFYGEEQDTETDTAYLMWLDDGSYEKLW